MRNFWELLPLVDRILRVFGGSFGSVGWIPQVEELRGVVGSMCSPLQELQEVISPRADHKPGQEEELGGTGDIRNLIREPVQLAAQVANTAVVVVQDHLQDSKPSLA